MLVSKELSKCPGSLVCILWTKHWQ